MSFAELERQFIGFIGLRRRDLNEMTVSELLIRLNFSKKLIEDRERNEWERMRLQTVYILNFFCGKGKGIKEPHKFMPLPWDKEKNTRSATLTKEAKKQSLQRLLDAANGTEHPTD